MYAFAIQRAKVVFFNDIIYTSNYIF